MKPLLKSFIAILVAASVGVPVGFYAYQLSNSAVVTPSDFIPANSTDVVELNINNTVGYFFISNDYPAAVLQISAGNITSLLSNISGSKNAMNNSSLLSMSPYESYKGYMIYNISLSNKSSLSNLTYGKAAFPLNLTTFIHNMTMIFLSPISSKSVITGTLQGIKYGIDAATGSSAGQFPLAKYFEEGTNLSLFLVTRNTSVSTITLNVFQNRTDGNITFTEAAVGQQVVLAISATSTVLGLNVTSMKLESTYVTFSLDTGTGGLRNLAAFFEKSGWIGYS
ncbi:MAG: hypothetical protein QXV22_04495 [Thermoplasmataceae archaeon]